MSRFITCLRSGRLFQQVQRIIVFASSRSLDHARSGQVFPASDQEASGRGRPDGRPAALGDHYCRVLAVEPQIQAISV
jgi:hypothetical protein